MHCPSRELRCRRSWFRRALAQASRRDRLRGRGSAPARRRTRRRAGRSVVRRTVDASARRMSGGRPAPAPRGIERISALCTSRGNVASRGHGVGMSAGTAVSMSTLAAPCVNRACCGTSVQQSRSAAVRCRCAPDRQVNAQCSHRGNLGLVPDGSSASICARDKYRSPVEVCQPHCGVPLSTARLASSASRTTMSRTTTLLPRLLAICGCGKSDKSTARDRARPTPTRLAEAGRSGRLRGTRMHSRPTRVRRRCPSLVLPVKRQRTRVAARGRVPAACAAWSRRSRL